MTKVLTVRVSPQILRRAEARAARLGLDRAQYVRALLEEDLQAETREPQRQFASEDLVGCYAGDGRPATNAAVRQRVRERAGR